VISIVTSTLDAVGTLPHTLRSLAAQRGADFEWLVVDGGSRDGTVDLLQANAGRIAWWTSEPDGGFYDAWNKALARAKGDWLLFVGSGDEFAAPDTLARFSEVLAGAHPEHDLVYGRVRYVSALGRVDLDEAGAPWEKLRGRWEIGRPALPPHPGIFHHRSLFSQGRGFDPRYRIAGDAHFLLKHALGKPPLHVPRPVVRTPIGGLSMRFGSALAVSREISRINAELGLRPPLGHRVAETLRLAAKLAARLPGGCYAADAYRRLIGLPPRWSVR
jgi:glycosyltransferase involved in cell wall biosynthesis